ncbi:WD40 repeat [Dillenia turbinata]|uniref:WD40 repeat n=1 Tax=Dillenia turbinata TaxID=194707 RepID=A0AAN8W0E7_9MAGN
MKSNRIKPKKLNESSKLDRKETTKLTTKNANGLASSGSDGKFVYLEGFAVGVCDVESGIRSRLVVSHRSPKTLICVESSRDGRFVAAGESGYQSAVLVWDCATQAFVYELKAHQYGISCIAFSPDGKYLVSVGAPQDGYICLWNLHGGVLVRKLRACFLSSAVASVCFSSDAKYIATAGKKHLKLWTIGSLKRSSVSTLVETLAMCRKPVKSGFLKESSFVCITSPGWINTAFACREQAREFFPIYALTDSGVLCLLNSELSVEKSVDLKVNKGFALSASNMLIACSCSAGVVKLFYVETLKYAGSFMYSERGKCHMENVKIPMDSEIMPSPDAIACQFSTSEKLVVVYGDHSFHIWNTHDAQKVDGGGCVFVWKVPNAFSSGMVHKMKENIGPSPARKAQISASSTSMLHEDTSDQCETKAEDISLLRSSNQVHESIHHEGARSVEISAFKFSISRLPKWAQDKLKNSETDTRCPLSTSSHGLCLGQSLGHCTYCLSGSTQYTTELLFGGNKEEGCCTKAA